VPLIMAGAGLPRNMKIDIPAGHVDMVATILELAGSDAYKKIRGKSLLPVIAGDSCEIPSFAYSESHSEGNCTGSFMVRKGDWKYIHFSWYDDLLFNVRKDPGEFNNLIDDPATSSVQAELKDILWSLVDPEEVTAKAFNAQKRILDGFVAEMAEEELFEMFRGRLGNGQARIMARHLKEG